MLILIIIIHAFITGTAANVSRLRNEAVFGVEAAEGPPVVRATIAGGPLRSVCFQNEFVRAWKKICFSC